MNISDEQLIKDWKHPGGLYDTDGMNTKALKFFGADIIDHTSYEDKVERKALKNRG